MKKDIYIRAFSVYNDSVRQPPQNMKNTTTSDLNARKNLIAEIARRHAADREFIKSVSVKETTTTSDEHDAVIAEEFARLENASVILG